MRHVRWFLSVTVIAVLCAGQVACTGAGTFATSLTPPSITGVTLNPNFVEAGLSALGTVTISPAAPAGGVVILLSSDNPVTAFPPASVTILAGATSANFTVNTTSVNSQTVANITGMLNGTFSAPARLTVDPATAAQVQSVSLNPTTVRGGMGVTGTVTLTQPPTNPAAVRLTSGNSAVTVPGGSVEVQAGQTVATFPITTAAVASQVVVTITVTLNNTMIVMLTVTP